MKIGILIDTGASIIESQLSNTNIEHISLHVILEDGTDFLDTPENLESNKIWKRLQDDEHITTSMASPGELMQKYDSMLKKYDHILHLTITSNLSGMHDTALMVAKDDDYKGKVTIIEHNLAANAITYLALKMDEMIKNGVTNIDEFQKFADLVDTKVFLGIIPGDVAKLSRGGRTKSMMLSFLKMFKTRFLIQWGKKPEKIGMGRTIGPLVDKSINIANKMAGKEAEFILVSTPVTSQKTLDNIRRDLESKNIKFIEETIPSIYPCHAGADTLGLIAIPKELQ